MTAAHFPSRPLVGVSTGAIDPGSTGRSVVRALEHGIDVLELSALAEPELYELERTLVALDRTGRRHSLRRISVHGPAKALAMPEHELAEQLGALTRRHHVPVVMHPDAMTDLSLWGALGEHLLLENADSRKDRFQRPDDLDAAFRILPLARFCLDVSHALDAGGPDLVDELATRYAGRLAQIHAGCAGGKDHGGRLERDVLDAVTRAVTLTVNHAVNHAPEHADTGVPVICERHAGAEQHALPRQMRDLLEAVTAARTRP